MALFGSCHNDPLRSAYAVLIGKRLQCCSLPKNPLAVRAALLFAALFVAMMVVTHLAIAYLGNTGEYVLAGIMGFSDVDPFILG